MNDPEIYVAAQTIHQKQAEKRLETFFFCSTIGRPMHAMFHFYATFCSVCLQFSYKILLKCIYFSLKIAYTDILNDES
jgi:hypothetical protein